MTTSKQAHAHTHDVSRPPDAVEAAQAAFEAFAPKSVEHYRDAAAVLPGGTTRPRFFWPQPIYISHGDGAWLFDIDGNRYVDCNLSFGPLILGHCHPEVVAAIQDQLQRGLLFGAPVPAEAELAQTIVSAVPGAEQAFFVNSGTEATMAAIRLARAATGRNKVAKFEGGWHGWSESLFYSIGAAEGDVGQPSTRVESPGLPRAFADNLLTLPYNDSAAFERLRSEAGDVACVIVEAVQGAAGCLVADPHFLQTLRSLCTELDVVFILDEVITGFRLGPSGAAGRLGIEADITALGKALGGGLPIGAVCGRSDFLSLVVPDGDSKPVTLAGTTSGNPLTLAAGGAQINRLLSDNGAAYETLERLGARLRSQLEGVLDEVQVRGAVTGIGSMWGLHLMCDVPPRSIREKSTGAELAMSVLAGYLHLEGVHIMSPVHLGFVSTAHTEDDVDFIAQAHLRALSRMKDEGLLSEVQV